MPVALPWFGNQVDPTIPQFSNIVVGSYWWDDSGTYDVVDVRGINGILRSSLLPTHFFTPAIQDCLILIDRYNPWVYGWADNYSDQLYEFLKEFAGSFVYDYDFGLSVVGYGLRPALQPISYNLASYAIAQSLTITLPQTATEQDVILTWLRKERSFVGNEPAYNEFSKNYLKLKTSTRQRKLITLDFSDFVVCSLVVSASTNSLIFNIQNQFTGLGYLYFHLPTLLADLKNQILTGLPNLNTVLTSIDYSYTQTYGFFSYKIPNDNRIFYAYSGEVTEIHPTFSNPQFEAIPQHLKASCLIHAKNNYWNEADYPRANDDRYIFPKNPAYDGTANTPEYLITMLPLSQFNKYPKPKPGTEPLPGSFFSSQLGYTAHPVGHQTFIDTGVQGFQLYVELFVNFTKFSPIANQAKANHFNNSLIRLGGTVYNPGYTIYASGIGSFYFPLDPTVNYTGLVSGNYGYNLHGFALVKTEVRNESSNLTTDIIFNIVKVNATVTKDSFKNNTAPPFENVSITTIQIGSVSYGDTVNQSFAETINDTIHFDIPHSLNEYEHDNYLATTKQQVIDDRDRNWWYKLDIDGDLLNAEQYPY
jgi:hypothetical protein